MVENTRKYGILLSDNDSGELTVIVNTFKNYGAVESDNSNGIIHLTDWKVPRELPDRWGNFKGLVAKADDLEFHVVHEKRIGVEYVSQNLDKIDLVIMSLNNNEKESDITGVEAARTIRKNGYKNWIALRSSFITTDMARYICKDVIDDMFSKGPVDSLYGYIAIRYSIDRKK